MLDLLGSFPSTLNNAIIMKHVLADPAGISNLLQKYYIFILDRGFRDVKDYLQTQGFKVLLRALKGKEAQLPSDEANASHGASRNVDGLWKVSRAY